MQRCLRIAHRIELACILQTRRSRFAQVAKNLGNQVTSGRGVNVLICHAHFRLSIAPPTEIDWRGHPMQPVTCRWSALVQCIAEVQHRRTVCRKLILRQYNK